MLPKCLLCSAIVGLLFSILPSFPLIYSLASGCMKTCPIRFIGLYMAASRCLPCPSGQDRLSSPSNGCHLQEQPGLHRQGTQSSHFQLFHLHQIRNYNQDPHQASNCLITIITVIKLCMQQELESKTRKQSSGCTVVWNRWISEGHINLTILAAEVVTKAGPSKFNHFSSNIEYCKN